MENCLVTKLKAVVNNPNLPILETMQQFTLNAIAASGNNELTDEQKWAFNHFFFQVGAISNNGIWPKLKAVILPFMALDKSHAIIDYKTNSAEFSAASYTTFTDKMLNVLVSGGVQQKQQLKTIDTISLDNFSFISTIGTDLLYSDAYNLGLVDGSEIDFNVYKRNNNNYQIVEIINVPSSGSFYSRTLESPKTNVINGFAISLNGIESDSMALHIDGSTLREVTPSIPAENHTITDGILSLAEKKFSSVIVGEFLTKAELIKLTNALIELKTNFYSAD